MIRTPIALSLLVALSGLVVACSSVSDDVASGEDDYRVKPKDSENWANLTIALPTGSCLPGNTCTRPLGTNPSIQLDGSNVAIGATTRVRPGDHVIAANGGTKKITLSAGQQRTFVLPVARSKCTATALGTVPQTDFGKTVTLTNAVCPTTVLGSSAPATPVLATSAVDPYYSAGCGQVLTKFGTPGTACSLYAPYTVYGLRINGGECLSVSPINAQTACNAAVANDWSWAKISASSGSLLATDQAFVPDTYSVTIDGATKTFKLDEGDLTDVPLTLPALGTVPNVFTTKLSFVEARELPSAGLSTTISSSCAGDRNYTVAPNAQGTLELKAFAAPGCVYTLSAGGRTAELTQTSTNTFKIHRLDVDDVEVQRENGSVYNQRGTYELFFNGARVVGPLPTNTGIDVLPGTYELVISYSTADGAKTQRQTFTL